MPLGLFMFFVSVAAIVASGVDAVGMAKLWFVACFLRRTLDDLWFSSRGAQKGSVEMVLVSREAVGALR